MVIVSVLGTSKQEIHAADNQLHVDISDETGDIHHGAGGFLYGLGDEGIPTDAVLYPLKPSVAAQKPQYGLQHPNGNAFDIAPQFMSAGGKNVQIYMQDMYEHWPYDNLGIEDYLGKVQQMAYAVAAQPNSSDYVYIPFNEPDWIWYGNDINRLFNDWKRVYDTIKAIDPDGRIGGINYASFNEDHYRQFMTFAKANNCVPDVMTWHELFDSFFTSYYDHYNAYRQIETDLGIAPRPIVINEYARSWGDLGYPGNMIQWIARFENTKVDACRAYWGAAGNLDELVVENNKANGDWWLYKWYGDMTGKTVRVNPPTQNAPLQGVATFDSTKNQVRVIFGGGLGRNDVFNSQVTIEGLNSKGQFGNTVHGIVLGVDPTHRDDVTGFEASDGPYVVSEGDYSVVNGRVSIPVDNMKALSAYQIIITADTDRTSWSNNRYESEYAELVGAAYPVANEGNYSGTGYVQGFGFTDHAAVTYTTSVPENGYYDVRLRYSAGDFPNAPTNRKVRMELNGEWVKDITVSQTGGWSDWQDAHQTIYLQGGINQITLSAFTNDEEDCVNQDYIELTPSNLQAVSYEAESANNSLYGSAVVEYAQNASGQHYVGWIGNGSNNALSFENIQVPKAGQYRLVIYYSNAEKIGNHAYNTNVVDRTSDIHVNGVEQITGFHFRNTYDWSYFSTTVVDVMLEAGNNSILFESADGFAPNIDRIDVAALLQ